MKIDTTNLAAAFAASSSGTSKKSSDFGALLEQASAKQSDAASELQEYVDMSPAERMTQAMMKKLGITQEAFNAMTPAQQTAVMNKINQMIQQQMEQQTAQNQGAALSIKI